MKPPPVAMGKRDRLTLSQLASYDDILTDALVDHVSNSKLGQQRPQYRSPRRMANKLQVYFWTTIRKNRSKYNLTRGISEDDVTRILLHELIVAKDPQKAEASLLQLSGIRKYLEKLNTEREKEDFRKHLRKYLNIWSTDCPFEVSTTNRYTITTHEAAATARKFIKKGETIKYLCGQLVAITSEEEKDLDLTRRDFSIVMSSRKKTPLLFLGPARFANHDCNANARLNTKGLEGMEVVAVRNIEVGQEITVTYGDDYFGLSNRECLCGTCESMGRNGWAAGGDITSTPSSGTVTPSIEDTSTDGPYMFRKKRKYIPPSETASAPASPIAAEIPAFKKPKLDLSKSLPATPPSEFFAKRRRSMTKSNGIGSALKRELLLKDDLISSTEDAIDEPNVPATPTSPQKARSISGFSAEELSEQVKAAFGSPTKQRLNSYPGAIREITETRARSSEDVSLQLQSSLAAAPSASRSKSESVSGETPITPITSSMTKESPGCFPVSDADSIFSNDVFQSSSSVTTPDVHLDPESKLATPAPDANNSDSELSQLSENEELDDATLSVVRKPKAKRRYRKFNPHSVLPTVEKITSRTPSDYIRTPLLLGESFSRWVECSTCPTVWVQLNGYYTRKECPRCERHSKLYGYQWPKTDKAKGEDTDDRVMDHRTVHRFLGPEDEKAVKKRGRGLYGDLKGRSQSTLSRSQSAAVEDVTEDDDGPPRKRTRRGRSLKVL